MSLSLKDRIESYQDITDYKSIGKIPMVICINGRSFSKATSMISKPYSSEFAEVMAATTLKLCYEVDNAIFGYSFHDEIILILKNDNSSWYNNKIQKICSATSSLATLHFNNYISELNIKIIGDACFTSQVFNVPNNEEVINTLIYKQNQSYNQSINWACFYELLKNNFDRNEVKNLMSGLTNEEKIDLLKDSCNIDFKSYPKIFSYGLSCYKSPKIINGTLKYKWCIDENTPHFREDKSLLNNIINCGHDILRTNSVL